MRARGVITACVRSAARHSAAFCCKHSCLTWTFAAARSDSVTPPPLPGVPEGALVGLELALALVLSKPRLALALVLSRPRLALALVLSRLALNFRSAM